MSDLVSPVLRERVFIDAFFTSLSKFTHDKAKDLVYQRRFKDCRTAIEEIDERTKPLERHEEENCYRIQQIEPDKEHAGTKNKSTTILWSSFLNLLNTLVTSEKVFFSLAFLNQNIGSRFLGRKDVLITAYNCLAMELHKIEVAHRRPSLSSSYYSSSDARRLTSSMSVSSALSSAATSSSIATSAGNYEVLSCRRDSEEGRAKEGEAKEGSTKGDEENLEEMIVSLCGQLQHFTMARIATIRLYEQLLSGAYRKHIYYSYEDSIKTIEEILDTFNISISHPILNGLKSSFILECEIISNLLRCQVSMQNNQFISSLTQLKDAKVKLDVIIELITTTQNETRRQSVVGMGSARSSASGGSSVRSELFSWFCQLYAVLLSKFNLYFFEVFIKEASLSEVRATMMKSSIDYYAKLTSFQKRTEALSVCLVLNTNDLTEPYQGPGYHLPPGPNEPSPAKPSGLDSFPSIFSHPSKPDRLWPTVVSILTSHSNELSITDRVVFVYDDLPLFYDGPTLDVAVCVQEQMTGRHRYAAPNVAELLAKSMPKRCAWNALNSAKTCNLNCL